MAKAHKLTGVEPLRSYRENARTILPQKVEEVWSMGTIHSGCSEARRTS